MKQTYFPHLGTIITHKLKQNTLSKEMKRWNIISNSHA
jgi:hypothetical protein